MLIIPQKTTLLHLQEWIRIEGVGGTIATTTCPPQALWGLPVSPSDSGGGEGRAIASPKGWGLDSSLRVSDSSPSSAWSSSCWAAKKHMHFMFSKIHTSWGNLYTGKLKYCKNRYYIYIYFVSCKIVHVILNDALPCGINEEAINRNLHLWSKNNALDCMF